MLRYVLSRARARMFVAFGALAAVLILSGCGKTILGTTSGAGSSTSQTATASASQGTGTPSAGGCPGPVQSVQWASAPTVIVTTNGTPVTLAVGQTLEVREPNNHTYQIVSSTYAPALRLDSPAGYEDPTLHACIWHFTAVQPGTGKIELVIGPLCVAHVKCPQYVTGPMTIATVTVH